MSLDTDYGRDKEICPLCNGHQLIDTDRSNAFGLGLNCEPNAKNPYNFKSQHYLFVNFQIGRDTQVRETLEQAFGRLL